MWIEPLDLFGHGKVILTGEYAVMKGAKALVLPTKPGQKMKVRPQKSDFLEWESYLPGNEIWMKAKYSKDLSEILEADNLEMAKLIQNILQIGKKLQPDVFRRGYKITTKLEFDKNWGLGTSSTLIANLSKWLQVNPFELLDETFGGSGFDVVVSLGGKKIIFQRSGYGRQWNFVDFKPPFAKDMYFVYLNKKQPTQKVVDKFKHVEVDPEKLERISSITEEVLEVKDKGKFMELMEEHEQMIGKMIRKKPVKTRLFKDFSGIVKSLGAWGGDLVLAVGDGEVEDYFKEKGYDTVIPYSKLMKP